jgi:two-component system sensor histidine kinase YesM
MLKLVKYPTRLFTLMVLCFVGFSSLFLLISGIVYYTTYSEIAYREIRETKKELLDETSQKLSNYVTGVQDTAKFLVTSTTVHQFLSEPAENNYDFVEKSRDLYEEFQKIVTVKEGLHSIELYTDWLIGHPVFLEEFMHPMEDAQKQGWLNRMDRADGFWIETHPITSFKGEQQVVSYVHRIIGNRGKILGVVKINIQDGTLFKVLNKRTSNTVEDKYYMIMDSTGQYIASALPEEIAAHDKVEKLVMEVENTRYSVIQSDANTQYWMLVQLIPKDVLLKSGKEIRVVIIELLLVLIILSIPLAFLVSKKLTSPINEIVKGMRTVEKGDFDVRMEASSIQEYLYLSTQFNRMVQRLKDLIGRLNQEHRDRREAEIQLLHAQIKPHFLYNTLDMIHWRALDHNAQDISQMVQQLSKLFRIGLSNDRWYVKVRDELSHARCYMAIQEFRQKYQIVYEEFVNTDLLDVMIPKIILQPFLENAVIHGFRYRSEPAVVQVRFEQQEIAGEAQVIVTITDNGQGVPEGFDVQSTGGIGIRNVIDRIQLYCGPGYGLRVIPGESMGTKVIMNLPLIRDEERMEQLQRSLNHEYDSIGG